MCSGGWGGTLQQLKKRDNEMEKNLYIRKILHGSTGRSADSAEKNGVATKFLQHFTEIAKKDIDF